MSKSKSNAKSSKTAQSYKIIIGVFSVVCSVVLAVFIVHLFVMAGELNPSGAPGDTMKTLDDIYCAMTIDTTATSYDEDSPGSVASTMHTLQEIYDKAVKFPLPDTGQVTCYSDREITCGDAPAGQDPEYTSANSFTCALSYTDNGDGTVTDNCTGLMWKQCAEPDADTAGTCGGTHSQYTWANALGQCEGLDFAGHTDWRLPNIKELFGIALMEYEAITGVKARSFPAINQTVFPSTPTLWHWSSNTNPHDVETALQVGFDVTQILDRDKADGAFVRCVRGQ